MGQTGWSLTFGPAPEKLLVSDAVEMPSGEIYFTMAAFGSTTSPDYMPSRSWIGTTNVAGTIQEISQIEVDTGRSFYATDIVYMPSGELVTVGFGWQQDPPSDFQVLVHTVHSLDSCVLSAAQNYVDSLRISYLNTSLDQEGKLFITGSLAQVGFITSSRMLLVRAAPQDGILASTILTNNGGMCIGRFALPSTDSLMRVSMDGNISGAPWGYTNFHRFNLDLEHVDGFALTSVGGSSSTTDSVLHDCLYMTPLAGDTFIVSGRFGNIFPDGMRAALVRLAPDGTYAGMFLPRSNYVHDYIGQRQGHDMTPDDKVVFAMVENFTTGPPDPELGTAPSRIHVYRLDTLLNVECDYIVDGFPDNAYYYLSRIEATADGGVLLMGSRRDLNTMAMPRGWLMKLGPDQCNPVSITEREQMQAVEVFPNPGTDHFTLVLNGPLVSGAYLEVADLLGNRVLHIPLYQSVLQVDAGRLAAGMYVYRVVGREGRTLGQGKWVKR